MAAMVTCLTKSQPCGSARFRSVFSYPRESCRNASRCCQLNLLKMQSSRDPIENEAIHLITRARTNLRGRRAGIRFWPTSSLPIFVDVSPLTPKISAGRTTLPACRLKIDSEQDVLEGFGGPEGDGERRRAVWQRALWILAGGYILWLFILPNAPGDPVWAITSETISMLTDLSLNFFYVLPILDAGGLHVMESAVVHPTAEALFNLVLGWTVMFAPLLFTDEKKDRFKGPLELWWILQMFLTNTFLIPYMAIRLETSKDESESEPLTKTEGLVKLLHFPSLRSAMISEAFTVGAAGSVVGALTVLWFFWGRSEFGNVADRWNFFLSYVSTDRVAYAFIWDLVLYSVFQPWLIGDNLSNVEKSRVELVRKVRFVPYIGLIAYLWSLPSNRKL